MGSVTSADTVGSLAAAERDVMGSVNEVADNVVDGEEARSVVKDVEEGEIEATAVVAVVGVAIECRVACGD